MALHFTMRKALISFATILGSVSAYPTSYQQVQRTGLQNGIFLRVEPLGASIVRGDRSTDQNGFRQDLRNYIVNGGNPTDFVGTEKAGNMTDNGVSGYPGATIAQIGERVVAGGGLDQLPNVILFNGGTNNCVYGQKTSETKKEMDNLLDLLFGKVKSTTIILSSIIISGNATREECGAAFNSLLPGMVKERLNRGQKIVFADMHGKDGPQADDLTPDGIHPDDVGYGKMAKIWYKALQTAAQLKFLTPAAPLNSTMAASKAAPHLHV